MMNDEEDDDCNDYHNAVVDGDSSDDDDDDIDDDDEEEAYDEVMASTMLGTTIQMDDGQNDETGRHDDGACGDCPDRDGSGDDFHDNGDG